MSEELGIGIEPVVEQVLFGPERLVIRRSKNVGKLVEALVAAQLEYDVVAKDAENDFYSKGQRKAKYATLDSAVMATRPHLNKHGLAIIQHLTSNNREKELTVTTSLYHTSEQYFESELTLPSAQGVKFDPQTMSSASTYGRRITWLAIAGAAPGDDDDANAASGNVGSREQAKAKGEEKLAELKAKMNGEEPPAIDDTSSLFYVWNNDNQTALITGHDTLLKLHKPYLKQFWSPSARALVVNAEQLENMKYEMEQRKVPFHPLKAM